MIDYSAFKFGKGKPRAVARMQARQQAEQDLREAYRVVDQRDNGKCIVTGTHTEPSCVDPRRRREHHHLVPRSRSKGRRDDPNNIITLCATAHMLITQGLIVVEGTDASKAVRFHWRADVPVEDRVIRIRSRRRSQNP